MDQHPAKEIPVLMVKKEKVVLLLQRKLLRSKAKIRQVAAIIKSKTSRERMQKRHRQVEQILKKAAETLCLSKVGEGCLPLANKKRPA